MSRFAIDLGASAMAAGIALVVSAPAMAAPSENWVLVGSTVAGDRWFVQADSPRIVGRYIESTIKHVPHRGLLQVGAQFDYEIDRRIDDCAARSAANEDVTLYRNSGAVIQHIAAPRETLRFAAREMGSVSETLSAYVCETAFRKRPAVTPAVPLDGIEPGDWHGAGTSADGAFNLAYLPRSVRRHENFASILIRSDYPHQGVLAYGGTYSVAINELIFDCVAGTYGVSKSDFYDERSRPIYSYVQEANELKLARLPSGAVIEPAARAACAVSAEAGEAHEKKAPSAATGTGWLTEQGYLVTASHVIEGASRVGIYQGGKLIGPAEVVADDPANDVAVLKPDFDVSAYGTLHVRVASTPLGAHVFTLGYPIPGDLGYGLKLTSGDVSALAGVDVQTSRPDDVRYLQISVPVQGGNSGGPVIAEDGSVIGIVISKQEMSDREITQNVNFALKARYVAGVLADLPAAHGHPAMHPKGNTATLAATLQSGVFLVYVERQ